MKTHKVRSYVRNKKSIVPIVYPGVAIYLYSIAFVAIITTLVVSFK